MSEAAVRALLVLAPCSVLLIIGLLIAVIGFILKKSLNVVLGSFLVSTSVLFTIMVVIGLIRQ